MYFRITDMSLQLPCVSLILKQRSIGIKRNTRNEMKYLVGTEQRRGTGLGIFMYVI